MKRDLRGTATTQSGHLLLLVALGLAASGCGRVAHMVKVQPPAATSLRGTTLGEVRVSSEDPNADALILNEDLKRVATQELQALLASKRGSDTTQKQTIEAQVEVDYGNRALRYFVGFGAGKGWIHVTISLKGADGNVIYSSFSEAVLGIGIFGGDMKAVAENAIKQAVNDFGSKV